MRESLIIQQTIKLLYDTFPDALVIRVNSGAFKVGNRYIRTTNFPGISDIVFVHEKATIFIETKTEKGKLNDNQVNFQRKCMNKKIHYVVVRNAQEALTVVNSILEKESQ